ncbi:FtsK/SpoIIIE domain-containing protein [Phycicoccus sp.]|uniref:FtsK/SpoIIIE domain-containing protein n=1 Tax=Phycicoccus sp. TaxID=1902410 RepID=UPI002BE59F2B|nr:FtsK/SpoIIIE domain-containing protein [Phycicoccus sp.]HMM95098.1 FtsK/SpoIIIE domain-containing protein [Phycicoccus sp.]
MNENELLQWAATCEASGDQGGATAAYRQADELGSADAAVLLGQVLHRTGYDQLAREAFARGEARGHREAAMCLGNLLNDSGDASAAREAYERAIAAGSTMAVLNLGLMLAQNGETEAAKRYLLDARSNGDTEACWAIGRVLETEGDLETAAVYYKEGADAGDANAAYGLASTRYGLGDVDGALDAFRRARDLGHEGAGTMIDLLGGNYAVPEQVVETSEPTKGSDGWSHLVALWEVLADARRALSESWLADQTILETLQAQAVALEHAVAERSEQLNNVCKEFGTPRPPRTGRGSFLTTALSHDPDNWVSRPQPGSPMQLSAIHAQAFDADIRTAWASLRQARDKLFSSAPRREGAEALGRFARRLGAMEAALDNAVSRRVDASAAQERHAARLAEEGVQKLAPARETAATVVRGLPPILQPWASEIWQSWLPPEPGTRLRHALGGSLSPRADPQLGPNATFGAEIALPWATTLHENLIARSTDQEALSAFVRSLMLRHLVSVAPGELQMCIFDPVGLGQSAGDLLDLAEYDADLIGGKVWTSAEDLETRLQEVSAHIELVVQKYLRTTYASIDEFNADAGEVAEPYRLVVLFGFPQGLTERSMERLKNIVRNGPRCGVYTLIAHDPSSASPHGVRPGEVEQLMTRLDLSASFTESVNGYALALAFRHESLPRADSNAKRVVDLVGRASIERSQSAVSFEKTFGLYSNYVARGLRPELGSAAISTRASDPSTWWMDDSARGLFAPIGQKGARDVAILGFDSTDHAGALLVGRPGSGKSTLLHTYIAGLTTLYGPEELELYLIDFKEGVEFKAYAEHKLPHAKVIAIESDREFGFNVLESVQKEISRRAELLRATGGGHTGVEGLRASTGDKVPRILLLFDEFQVLFTRNDALGQAAADRLESIIRQGRGFGVHVLLGSQSVAGLDALGAHVLRLLPVRLLLPASEPDARAVLGEGNPAGDYLTVRGEGVLNGYGGAVQANERFRGALLPESDRVARIRAMRSRADAIGLGRTPIVFEGSSLHPLDQQASSSFREELAATGAAPVRIRVGVPMTVGEVGDISLLREMGSNVLAVVRGGESLGDEFEPAAGPAYGLLVAAVASASTSAGAIDIVDFMPVDDGLDTRLEPLLEVGRISLRRRRAFPDVVASYLSEVRNRIESEDPKRPARVLFLFGIHRARELDPDVTSLDTDQDLLDGLESILRDGPEVGIHTCLWADSVSGVARRMTPRMMREMGWRIAGRMSADDSQNLIGSGLATQLRDNQLVLVNDDRGSSTRLTGFAPPSRLWLSEVIQDPS